MAKEGLKKWFSRNGGKGWIDCRTGKPCGRKSAKKGKSKRPYPACRPTKAQCNSSMRKKKGLQESLGRKERKMAKSRKKPCKPSKGKRFAKRVKGKCRSFGQKGKAKDGGDRIRPGTKKGDAYCARSAGIKKCKNPPCANALSRKKWKCRGKKSMK